MSDKHYLRLMMNEQTQKNQGYAFIEYMDSNNAKEAVKNLNGYPLQDTKLKVQFNTKQPPWYANSYNRSKFHKKCRGKSRDCILPEFSTAP